MGGQITHLMSKTEHALTPFFCVSAIQFYLHVPKMFIQ